MIVHDSFLSAVLPESRVYIHDDNRDKEISEDHDNIEMSSDEGVNSQELEKTPQKRSVSLNNHNKNNNNLYFTNVHWVRRTMRRDGEMT